MTRKHFTSTATPRACSTSRASRPTQKPPPLFYQRKPLWGKDTKKSSQHHKQRKKNAKLKNSALIKF
jgi:hypothetical protein